MVRSGSHCRYCPAKLFCKANLQSALNAVDAEYSASTDRVSEESIGDQIKLFTRAKQALDHRLTGLLEQAVNTLKSGKPVKGYTLTPSYGNRAWNIDEEELEIVSNMLGEEHGLFEKKLITPAAAERLGVRADVIDHFTSRKSSLKLKAVSNVAAFNEFTPIERT